MTKTNSKGGYGRGGAAADVGAASSDANKPKVVNRAKEPTGTGVPGDLTTFGRASNRGTHPDASKRVSLGPLDVKIPAERPGQGEGTC